MLVTNSTKTREEKIIQEYANFFGVSQAQAKGEIADLLPHEADAFVLVADLAYVGAQSNMGLAARVRNSIIDRRTLLTKTTECAELLQARLASTPDKVASAEPPITT